jgi:capsular exopolysaccharide synthesis family protein
MDQVSLTRSDGDDQYLDEEIVEGSSGPRLDLAALGNALRRNMWLILATVAVAVLLALGLTALTTPKFTASASVQIEQQASRVLESEADVDPAVHPMDAERHLNTQLDILKSRAMAIRVAQSQRLFGNAKFFQAMNLKPDEAVDGPGATALQREAVLKGLSENLEVSLPRQSRVAQISFRSPDPAFAARIANSYAENLIISNLQRRYDSSSYARDFLRTQLEDARSRLEQSERQLNDYARRAALIRTGTTAGTSGAQGTTGSVTTDSLVQLNQALSAAQNARIQVEQRWRAASATPALSLPEVIENPAVQQLLQQRSEQLAALSEARQRYRSEHPSIRGPSARVAELDGQIGRLAGNIRRSLEERYRAAAGQEAALQARVGRLKSETLAEQDRSVQYNILSRGVDTNRAAYEGLLQRFREVSTAAGIATNNISIIDRADPPLKPSSPNLLLNLAIALFGGLALALVLVFLREQLDDTVRTADDVERKLGLPTLGVIPLGPKNESMLAVIRDPRSPVAEAYSALRTSLLFSTAHGLPESILLTSSQPGEGKSTTAIAVADNLARLGKSVLLIDADLRRPSLHKTLSMQNRQGLSNVLTGQGELKSMVQKIEGSGLSVLTSGPLPPNPAEILGQGSLGDLLRAAQDDFDCVIIDGPPVLGLADAPMLAAEAAATIFVLEADRNHRGRAKTAMRRLRMTDSALIGVVLTKFDSRKAGAAGYYGYEYYDYRSDSDTAPPRAA